MDRETRQSKVSAPTIAGVAVAVLIVFYGAFISAKTFKSRRRSGILTSLSFAARYPGTLLVTRLGYYCAGIVAVLASFIACNALRPSLLADFVAASTSLVCLCDGIHWAGLHISPSRLYWLSPLLVASLLTAGGFFGSIFVDDGPYKSALVLAVLVPHRLYSLCMAFYYLQVTKWMGHEVLWAIGIVVTYVLGLVGFWPLSELVSALEAAWISSAPGTALLLCMQFYMLCFRRNDAADDAGGDARDDARDDRVHLSSSQVALNSDIANAAPQQTGVV